jgi:transposase
LFNSDRFSDNRDRGLPRPAELVCGSKETKKVVLARKDTIENVFCRIKDCRRIATRYDELARNILAATTLIGALSWIKL